MKNLKLVFCFCMLIVSFSIHAEQACPSNGFDGAICRGHALSAQGKPLAALEAYTEAEKLTSEAFEKMVAITFQARSHRAARNVAQAIELYQKGYETAKAAKAPQGEWINLNEKSELLLGMNEAQKALDGFLLGRASAGNDNEHAESDRLIASAYKQLGDIDHAIEFQLKSSVLERRSGDLNHYLNATLELAALRIMVKEYPQAQRSLEESLSQAKAANSDYWITKTLLYLSRLEKSQNHSGLAQTLLQEADALAEDWWRRRTREPVTTA